MKGELMKKRILAGILAVSMVGALLTGCGKGASQSADAAPAAGQERKKPRLSRKRLIRREQRPMRS